MKIFFLAPFQFQKVFWEKSISEKKVFPNPRVYSNMYKVVVDEFDEGKRNFSCRESSEELLGSFCHADEKQDTLWISFFICSMGIESWCDFYGWLMIFLFN